MGTAMILVNSLPVAENTSSYRLSGHFHSQNPKRLSELYGR